MTLIKICGVTCVEDAALAIQAGADRIGFILWNGSRRNISLEIAREIAAACHENHCLPIPVFVDSEKGEIEDICQELNIDTIQLHGEKVKRLINELPYNCIYALTQSEVNYPHCQYVLCDHAEGGSGVTLNWDTFIPPKNVPWILAGGLTPENIRVALKRFKPCGVDVCSGVEILGTSRKDKQKICSFISRVKEINNVS